MRGCSRVDAKGSPSPLQIYKIGWWATISFWQIVNFSIYSLSAVAFVYRCLDLSTHDPEKQDRFRLLAFRACLPAASCCSSPSTVR